MSLEIIIEDVCTSLTVVVEDNPHISNTIPLSEEWDNQLVRLGDGYYVPPVEWGDIRNGTESTAIQVDEAVEQTLILSSQVEVLEGIAEEHTTQIASLEQSKVDDATYSEFVEDTLLALSSKVEDTDPRLEDSRSPTGPAGGVLSGTYPNPTFSIDMATQGELDQAILTRTTPQQAADAAPVQSVQGRTGDVTISKADVGLGSVDNTSDEDKPISTIQQNALDALNDAKVDKVAGKALSDQNYTLAEKNKLSILENYDDTAVLLSLNNKVDKVGGKQLSDENYTLAEKDKLSGVEEGATQNSTDAFLLDRSNHTGAQAISTVSGLSAALNSKVDAVEGMGLSQENFTTQEKDKLSLLEESMFKGMFSSYAELITAYPTAQAGNYAQVAGALGEPSTTYSWDVVTGQWVEQVPEASPEQIKQLYESNPDTNAFTDSEKSKLAGVATGATANQGTVTSVGLSLPTGLSVSGTPVTEEGVLVVTYSAGYSIPTNTKQGQWDSAYGWGNHANAGYLTEVAWGDVQGKPTTFMPVIGDTENTAVAGNDVRLEDAREWTALTVTQAEAETGTATTRRAWTAQRVRQATNAWWNNSSDKTKLDGIATGATANSTDAHLLNRANHTGTQAISTVDGLQAALDGKLDSSTASLEPAPGKIPLADGEGKIDLQWLGSDVVDKINSLSAYFIPTPTPTPDNFGDPLEGGFYTGMIWNCIALSGDSRSISLGRADFNVDTTDHLVYFGQMIEVRSISNPSNKFTGTVIGASIGRISLDVTEIGGSGTHSDWAVMSRFRVIAAPKAQGESATMMLKFENTAMPPETQTLTEGWKATNAMVAAGSAEEYPAAHWARSLMINGYSDFYIPARDELELQWRNLKPATNDNYDPDGLRGLSGINYQKDGAYGDVVRGRGLNLNSYPQGSTYTLTDPGQTAVVAFQTGGPEANAWGTTFWSSSEYSAAYAWAQSWTASSPGYQNYYNKTDPRRVRAVRRSII